MNIPFPEPGARWGRLDKHGGLHMGPSEGLYGGPKAPRHPNSERFHELLQRMGELHDKKQADYGQGDDPFFNVRASTNWGVQIAAGAHQLRLATLPGALLFAPGRTPPQSTQLAP